jgi:hypothetical protein
MGLPSPGVSAARGRGRDGDGDHQRGGCPSECPARRVRDGSRTSAARSGIRAGGSALPAGTLRGCHRR